MCSQLTYYSHVRTRAQSTRHLASNAGQVLTAKRQMQLLKASQPPEESSRKMSLIEPDTEVSGVYWPVKWSGWQKRLWLWLSLSFVVALETLRARFCARPVLVLAAESGSKTSRRHAIAGPDTSQQGLRLPSSNCHKTAAWTPT